MRWLKKKKRQNSETNKQPVKEKGRNKNCIFGREIRDWGRRESTAHHLRSVIRWGQTEFYVSGVWSGPAEIVHSWKDLLTTVHLTTVYLVCPTWASADFKRLEGLTFFLSGTSVRSWMKQIRHLSYWSFRNSSCCFLLIGYYFVPKWHSSTCVLMSKVLREGKITLWWNTKRPELSKFSLCWRG
jgi:hypothetical protein